MTTPFELAQQAANVAYDMTLFATGDEAQAAADYHDVMNAYNKRIVMVQHIDQSVEVHPGWIVGPAAQMWGWMGDDEITTGQIAELEARTAETANETEDSR